MAMHGYQRFLSRPSTIATSCGWLAFLSLPSLVSLALSPPSVASASELSQILAQIQRYSSDTAALGLVTSVSQLRDVRPTDWAFQALKSLVERYGCIAGYPDGGYRGNRAMTRYEFAAGLNACLDRVNELVASTGELGVHQEDLDVLQQLEEEFQAELATLRGRLAALEARTAELEANQFSTTTKLAGEATFDFGAALSGEGSIALDFQGEEINLPDDFGKLVTISDADVEDDLTFGGSVSLGLETSFTGEDLLTITLLAGNIQGYGDRTRVPEAALDYEDDTGNSFELDDFYYQFPVGKLQVFVGTVGLGSDTVAPTVANFADDTVGDFFGDNPLSYDFPDGAGLGVNYQLTDSWNLAAAYLADTDTASAAGKDLGFTNGNSTIFGQVTFEPSDRFTAALTYNHAYQSDYVGLESTPVPTLYLARQEAITQDAIGINAAYAINPSINLSGWYGYEWANSQDSNAEFNRTTWAVNLGFPDLLREGNAGGLSIGAFPHIGSESGRFVEEQDTPLLAQGFYRFQLSDNISIQPGVMYIDNPTGNGDKDSVWVGSIRTQLSF